MASQPTATFGDYRFDVVEDFSLPQLECLQLLGRGAFSTVRLVRDRRRKTLMTMKSVCKEFLRSVRKTHYVEKERLILEHLADARVVRLHALLEDDDQFHFIMEYLPYGDLLNYLTERGVLTRQASQSGGVAFHRLPTGGRPRVLPPSRDHPQRPQTR